jgi:hypothetical protein
LLDFNFFDSKRTMTSLQRCTVSVEHQMSTSDQCKPRSEFLIWLLLRDMTLESWSPVSSRLETAGRHRGTSRDSAFVMVLDSHRSWD